MENLKLISNFWNWIFLIFILVFLECWARIVYGSTFLLNPFVLQSILLFTAAPLLIGVGQTFVIISGGIDLSVAFAMGLASVMGLIFGPTTYYAGAKLGGVSFTDPTVSIIVIAISWAILLPIIVFFARRLDTF